MSPLRLILIWSPAAKTGPLRGMALARLVVRESAAGDERLLAVDCRMLLRVGGGLAVIAWLAAVLALGWWLERSPYNRITHVDLLLPWRWSELRDLRAQAYLAQGRDDLQAGRYVEGIFRIRAGLHRHPHDPAARLALAKLYVGAARWTEARNLLLPELQWAPSRAYLQFVFQQATRFDERELVVETCDRLLARAEAAATDHVWLVVQKAQALYGLGRDVEVLAVLDAQRPPVSFEAQQLKARALCRLHRGAEALAFVEGLSWHGPFEGARLQLLALAYCELGRIEELRATLARIVGLHPMEVEPWLFTIDEWWAAKQPEEAGRALRGFLQRFEVNRELLARAVARCAALPAPELVAACVASARERGQQWEDLEGWHGLACLRAGDWAGFERSVAQIAATPRRTAREQDVMLEWMQALIDAVRLGAPAAEARLLAALRGRQLALGVYRDSLQALETAQRWAIAESVAGAGLEVFPGSTELKAKRAAMLDRRTAEAARTVVNTAPATSGAKPSAKQLPVALPVDLWRELDALVAQRDWARAAKLVADVRRSDPEWIYEVAAELDWRETRIALEREDHRRVQQLVGQRLEQRKLDVGRALDVVRDYAARQKTAEARRLGELIVERVPESGPARRLLAELPAW